MPKKGRPGFAIYLTGLPASGKTTLAHALQARLSQRGIPVQILDSDRLRRILTPNPSYSSQERNWFYEVVAFIAALLASNGVNVIIAATAPRQAHRQAARARIDRFAEIYVNCSPEVCRARDPKGLWERADRGEIQTLPGAGAPYERPESPEVSVDSERLTVQEAAQQVMDRLKTQGFI